MGSLLLTPEWFYGYNIVLEIIFAVITLSVSYYAWKIYKISEERNVRLFSMAFTFIALSYFSRALINFIILSRFDVQVTTMMQLQNIYLFNLFGTYVYTILFLIGLLLLAYIALKIYSLRTFILLFMLVFTSLYFTPFKTFMLYLLSTLLLGFIVSYYFANYMRSRKTNTFLVLAAMVLLFAAYLSFLFSINAALYYFFGHLLEMLAYIILLVNLLLVLRVGRTKNGKKAR